MNNKIKSIGTVLGIGLSVFLISLTVLAWVGPPGAPTTCPSGEPGCDAPIHVGSATQTKSGTLILSDSTRGLEVDYGALLAIGGGNVGIGTTTTDPQAKLHIDGSLLITGEITADNNTLSNCAWTTPTCDDAVTCPAGKIAAGSQRHTGNALCGVDPTRWYEQSVYCCNL